MGVVAAAAARAGCCREHDGGEFSLHRATERTPTHRHLRHRRSQTAVRHGFSRYFIRAFREESADLDKNGRISVWEGFAFASAGVKRHYQQRGQLSTERALLDDNGDGVGRSASEKGEAVALRPALTLMRTCRRGAH